MASRSKALDILRALAVLLVLGRHIMPCPVDVSPFLNSVTEVWKRGGWIGVDLFFVLSGFLVSGLLFQEHMRLGRVSAKRFLIRRGFKIYPAFWLLILVTVLVGFFRHHPRELSGLVAELLFVQNYELGLWPHTWSLAVEEHFYFSLELLLLWFSMRRKGDRAFVYIPVCYAFVAITCLALRLLTSHSGPYSHQTHLYPSHLRVDSLFFGVLLSYYYHYYRDRFMALARHHRLSLVAAGILLLAPAFMFDLETTPFISTIGLTLFYLGSGCLMTGLLGVSLSEQGLSAGIAYVGSHSYSLYLWHVPLAYWGLPIATRMLPVKWTWPMYFACYVLGSVALGIIMAKLIEFPVLRVRDHWFPSSSDSLGRQITSGSAAVAAS